MSWSVLYDCRACGDTFFLTQGDPWPDEDVSYCAPCTDVIFDRDEHGTADDPWTPALIRKARGLL